MGQLPQKSRRGGSFAGRAFRCAALVALAALPWNTFAAAPSYSFVEIGHIDVGVDEFETDDFDLGSLVGDFSNFERNGDGRFFSGSFGAKLWHVFAEYRRAELQDGSGLKQKAWWVGGGWHGLLGEKADVVAEAAYIGAKVGTPLGDVRDQGPRFTGGLRFLPVRWFEMNGFYNLVVIDSPVFADSYEINVLLKLWLFRLGVGYERFENTSEARVFARYVFR